MLTACRSGKVLFVGLTGRSAGVVDRAKTFLSEGQDGREAKAARSGGSREGQGGR
jgi:hypothetical protein